MDFQTIRLFPAFLLFTAVLSAQLCAQDISLGQAGKPVYLEPEYLVSEELEEGRAPDHWRGRFGLGVQVSPDFLGARDHTLDLAVDLKLSYRDTIFIENNKLGIILHKGHLLRAGLISRTEFGRRDDIFRQDIPGLPSVGEAFEIGAFASTSFYKLFLSAEYYTDVSGVHGGAMLEAELGYTFEFNSKLKITPVLGARWGSNDYMQTYFGVPEMENQVYGPYQPNGGLYEWYAEVAGEHRISNKWLVKAGLRMADLVGPAQNSPIIRSEKGSTQQISAVVALVYLF